MANIDLTIDQIGLFIEPLFGKYLERHPDHFDVKMKATQMELTMMYIT